MSATKITCIYKNRDILYYRYPAVHPSDPTSKLSFSDNRMEVLERYKIGTYMYIFRKKTFLDEERLLFINRIIY